MPSNRSSRFVYLRRVIVQLLKDWHVPYSGEEKGWPLNPEVTDRWKKDDVNTSHRILAQELERMRRVTPHYSAIAQIFLQDDASYSSYDFLQKQAYNFGPSSDSGQLLPRVEAAIDWLTESLISTDLYCLFPQRAVKTARREGAEEKYLRIARVFDHFCEELKTDYIRFRNRAYIATADETGESRTTVERAIKWRDNDENHGQRHREANAAKKTRRHKRVKAATPNEEANR